MYQLRVQRYEGGLYVDSEELAKGIHESIDFVNGMIQVLAFSRACEYAFTRPNAMIKTVSYTDNITCETVETHKLNRDALNCVFRVLPPTNGNGGLWKAYEQLFDTLEKSDKQWEYVSGELDANNQLQKMNLVGYPMGWGDDPAPSAKDDGWTTKLTPDQVLKEI